MNESARDTGDEETVVNLELDGMLKGFLLLFQHLIKALGLGYRAGKSVKYKSGVASKQVWSDEELEWDTHLRILGLLPIPT